MTRITTRRSAGDLRAWASLLSIALIAACPTSPRPGDPAKPAHGETAPSTGGADALDTTATAASDGTNTTRKTACSRARGARFPSVSWIPADARLAVRLDLADPGLAPALEALSNHARAHADLPIVGGLALAQLGLQLSVVRPLLARPGFEPGELLLLHAPGGEPVWVLLAPCDLEELRAAVEAHWPVRTRQFVGGIVGEPLQSAGDGMSDPVPPFIGDVLFLTGDRVAITPRGAGTRLARWLEGHGSARVFGLGDSGPDQASLPPRGPGAELDAITGRAPVQVVIAGQGFLGLGAEGAGSGVSAEGQPASRSLVARPDGVEELTASGDRADADTGAPRGGEGDPDAVDR